MKIDTTKRFIIPKKLVAKAYELVKRNKGSGGVDDESISKFEENLKDNLYKIWNRMSAGSYFPPPVKAVGIPKKSGGSRTLGIPTVSDRVAQTVAKLVFEPSVEAIFLPDSYGYRPSKSALDAVGVTRERCWKYKWVLEFDIRGLFDNIPHDLLMKAVRKHALEKWVILYIERWLKAPMQMEDGTTKARDRGTPQGGVISPVLSNLFLHYAFDVWITKNWPSSPWCRYADDGLAHFENLEDAEKAKSELQQRFQECGLELQPTKTKIVYCKAGAKRSSFENTKFDFLGYTFRSRSVKNNKLNLIFTGFTPAVSKTALKEMVAKIRKLNIRNRTELSLQQIANLCNPMLQGWINYYGKFSPACLYPMYRHFNKTIIAWILKKYKRFSGSKTRAGQFLEKISKENSILFVHWRLGMKGGFA